MTTPAAPDPAAWGVVLDQLEGDLDRLEAALDAGDTIDPSPWTPPTGLGPLPDELRERASDVLARLQDLSDEVRDARTASLGEAQRTRQRRDATVAYHATG
ncbi:hypothetical protein [Nitriliruptor alkaliphilus]|uniref:hypothetical protein n=1 Tax=Nitriliruptor alkaliphilus TaxID=427918 RepID=UPI0012EE0EE0|nr:hypothetical protein [Nitriliruptor alkaliphilus]